MEDRRGSRQHEQVAPAQCVAVLRLDWGHEGARLVQVGVVLPVALGREALASAGAASRAVGRAVGAGAVPRQADEEACGNTAREDYIRWKRSSRRLSKKLTQTFISG